MLKNFCLRLLHEFIFIGVVQDQKKFHEQLNTEQEAIFGSKPSPARSLSTKKVMGLRANGANGTPGRRMSVAHQNLSRSINKDGKRDMRPVAPVNYVSLAKEDATSCISATEPLPSTP